MSRLKSFFFFNEDIQFRFKTDSDSFIEINNIFKLELHFQVNQPFIIDVPSNAEELLQNDIYNRLKSRKVNIQEELEKVNFIEDTGSLKLKIKISGTEYELLPFGADYELYIRQKLLNEIREGKKLYGLFCFNHAEFRESRDRFKI